ncbi:Aspartic proteinase A1 isoform 1 [Hibiscus syriacus]|uniref:Aspartic proteinase A1 isoform 1 n=1 Tax=Hibiscus syriacus TaxID=106335 RepID=A0A6A2XU27_HIBSY|nr:Aspartic proteinase A1 isoform 1 [Hibiscus syriacus]
MERTKSLILLIWFIMLNVSFLFEVDGSKTKSKGKYKYKLIHRHSPELGGHPKATLGPPIDGRQRIKQLVRSDYARYRAFQRMLKRPGRKTFEQMSPKHGLVELAMRSAADLGAGQYFISMRIGSPPKKFLMLVDTGSDLTWIKCRNKCSNCRIGGKKRKKKKMRFYHPNESRTYRPIPCSSSYCSTELMPFNSLTDCPTPDSACRYSTEYVDGQRVSGTFVNDTITIKMRGHKKVKLENMTIGCSESLISQTFKLDGLLGLGCIVQSFTGQAVKESEKKFCYCLVDHLSPSNLSSYLVFGNEDNQLLNIQETELLLGAWYWSTNYHVNVSGISLDGKMLDIPSDVWLYDPRTRQGGMILDTGTSLTVLAAPAYDKVMEGLFPSISRFPKLTRNWPGQTPGHCFNSTGFKETMVPRLAIHFADGAKFEPPVKSYVIDEQIGMKCLGFIRFDPLAGSIIGNILQQNHYWEFDIWNQKLRFAPARCTFD